MTSQPNKSPEPDRAHSGEAPMLISSARHGRASRSALEVRHMSRKTDHFGHRENDGLVVDLFWDRANPADEFRVEVVDRRHGSGFVLHPMTGKEAVHAFYHPFAAASAALNGKRMAA